jgi:hypothetical protein
LGYAVWRSNRDEEHVARKLLDAISTFDALGIREPDDRKPTSEQIASSNKLWPNGSAVVVGFMCGEATLQWKVAKVASEWAKYANLRFVFGEAAEAAIRISFGGAGTWSYVGTDALSVPNDRPTIELGWLTSETNDEEIRRVVLHEFGHALGLVHEHQIATAEIAWDETAVYNDLTGPPNNWTRQQIDVAMFQRYSSDYYPIEKKFDPKSIMMFPVPKNWTSGTSLSELNMELSDGDKDFVHKLYP